MIILISAVNNGFFIGKDNKLLYRLKKDMKFFVAQTTGHSIFMGRKTFESFPGLLPGRPHHVLSRHLEDDRVHIHRSFESMLEEARRHEKAFICGGEEIYKLFLPHADELLLTHIDDDEIGTIRFPDFNKNEWLDQDLESFNDEKSALKARIVSYRRNA